MLQTIELPTGIGHLAASLADVDGDTFSHGDSQGWLQSGDQEFRPYTQRVLEESDGSQTVGHIYSNDGESDSNGDIR